MVWKTSYNAGLGQPALTLAGVDTVARVAIGTVLKGFDDLFGEGEFIYLPGVASLLAGDLAMYDLNPSAVAVIRGNTGQANTARPVAWALAAVPAGSFGWYQISGVAVANVVGSGAQGSAFIANTGGITSTAAAGIQLIGARMHPVGTPAAGQSYVTCNRPSVQGQIT